jgi:hypothetical protein
MTILGIIFVFLLYQFEFKIHKHFNIDNVYFIFLLQYYLN